MNQCVAQCQVRYGDRRQATQEPLQVLTWNPHYQCFVNTDTCCKTYATSFINHQLLAKNIDFANFIDVENVIWTDFLPAHYTAIMGTPCPKHDVTTLVYNAARWVPSGDSISMCLTADGSDRAGLIQRFRSVADPTQNITVIGVHFSHDHPESLVVLKQALVSNGLQGDNIVLMGDTNFDVNDGGNSSNEAMMAFLGLQLKTGNELVKTCCLNDSGKTELQFTYDRIMTNFGTSMQSSVLPVTMPDGCTANEEMHLPLFGSISMATLDTACATHGCGSCGEQFCCILPSVAPAQPPCFPNNSQNSVRRCGAIGGYLKQCYY